MNRFPLILAIALTLPIVLTACNRPNSGEAATSATARPTATETGTVAFEPAYPEEVSTEGLTAEDAAQQEVHRHGDGEPHTHGAGSTTHGHDH